MSQDLFPVGGGLEQVKVVPANQAKVYLSRQYTQVNNLNPRKTEWEEGGRPVYDRLPAISERYKKDFPLDNSVAYTYIPYGEGMTGNTSMAVSSTNDGKFLLIKAGKIVWERGTIETDPVILDLETVGLLSTKYLIAYQLYYDDSPSVKKYKVSDFSLSGIPTSFASSTDNFVGWRYETKYAFCAGETFWKSEDLSLGNPPVASPFISWKLGYSASLREVTVTCPPFFKASGRADLYHKGFDWVLVSSSIAELNGDRYLFNFPLDNEVTADEWKIVWDNESAAVEDIRVTGEVSLLSKAATNTSYYSLVAYPENPVPDKFVNSLGEELPLTLCNLAYVDVNNNFKATQIKDLREIVYSDYTPISEWLTRFWDNNMVRLYNQVKDYSNLWMAPPTAVKGEYDTLKNNFISIL